MSSAAIQVPQLTQQYHYTPTQSPSRQPYTAAQGSPASSKRPSSRRSANGATVSSPSPMPPRAALASPVPVAASEPEYHHQSTPTSDRRKGHQQPPIAPPRTSSNQGNSSRRAAATASPRREVNGNMADASSPSARYRRHQPTQEAPSRSTSTRAANSSSKSPSRENSEILTRMVISQPEVDVDRERERLAEAVPHPAQTLDDAVSPPVVGMSNSQDDSRRFGRSRHDHSKRDKVQKFGDYYLGNTIGEGEFGKVKLGWKQHGGVQVAIKLIRKDTVGNNPTRLAKIHREVQILKGLQHPNIVRLHEMSETERHIGIVLEYASGGELFDYILNHRYLKDSPARRLFAQLVSGVGYLHKKGIVHRDLKLENLLLDRNKNIIITDFGFANTFDPIDELNDEQENSLADRDFVKRSGLDKLKSNGMRKGDLMQTSCGSPCYAAPELVVSDSLYTGRKVDVWSCGVILYAMLAGYLPFDDDPANPEGDNINLLYKYIVSTPLTFPEYVTPHARDLLRRILVPNPRKRADLFEVARHSWLSEFAHVVEFITSSTTTHSEIQNTTVPAEDEESPKLARSASVREGANKPQKVSPSHVGTLATKQGTVDAEAETPQRTERDKKRQTVQVEYVAPKTNTRRGSAVASGSGSKPRAHGPVEVPQTSSNKPLPQDPPVSRKPQSSQAPQNMPVRPSRDASGRITDNAYLPVASGGRPNTGGSMASAHSAGLGARNASYGQPLPPALADTNVPGRIQQPTGRMPSANAQEPTSEMGRPSISHPNVPSKFDDISGFSGQGNVLDSRPPLSSSGRQGHKRSSTLGSLFGRSGSLLGRGKKRPEPTPEKNSRKYPPVSMTNHHVPAGEEAPSRPSIDSRTSRRSFNIGFGKKRSGSMTGSQTSQEKGNRRFSLLKAIGLGKDNQGRDLSQQHLPIQDPPMSESRGGYLGGAHGYPDQQRPTPPSSAPAHHQRFASSQYDQPPRSAVPQYMQQGAMFNTGSDSSVDQARMGQIQPGPQAGYSGQDGYESRPSMGSRGTTRGTLQKNKHFNSYQDDHGNGGPAKRVMDFFRRRGRARGGEE
ncbi:Fatty acyl-CoA synthetase and RNA processing-associated kinase 1 [Zalerion maritima]|uniref:non-specific serine/threonine protein kinase n=1 Tax=Zalerion maritima TaxID=339359 RepID=A0AAD5RTH9_9PEZI|nr:Fatty acyl-CoA synthetase and RNA processing-associated kinase 1 [Zalerion maritima]